MASAAMTEAGPSTAGQSAVIDRTIHPSGIVPALQNIVATVNLDCKLELKSIALQARNAEYNPKVGGEQEVLGLHLHAAACCHLQYWRSKSGHLDCIRVVAKPGSQWLSAHACCWRAEVCSRHHAHPGPKDHSPDLCFREDGRDCTPDAQCLHLL